jgi:hypothetical protein
VTATTPVDSVATSGAIREVDAGGIDRYLFGATSSFDDRTDVVKGKMRWDIDTDTRLFAMLAYQESSSKLLDHESYLRDVRCVNGAQRAVAPPLIFCLVHLSIGELAMVAVRMSPSSNGRQRFPAHTPHFGAYKNPDWA